MTNNMEQPGFGSEFESLPEVRARIEAIKKAQREVLASKIKDRSLEDISRRFLIDGEANDIVPTTHVLIKLVPKARAATAYGVAELIIAVAKYDENQPVPRSLAENEEGGSQLTESLGYRLGNDLFLEVVGETPTSRAFYLLNPEGLSMQAKAREIEPVSGAVLDHMYQATAADSSTMASPEFEWGIYDIIAHYETTLQDNIRRTA